MSKHSIFWSSVWRNDTQILLGRDLFLLIGTVDIKLFHA